MTIQILLNAIKFVPVRQSSRFSNEAERSPDLMDEGDWRRAPFFGESSSRSEEVDLARDNGELNKNAFSIYQDQKSNLDANA